MTTKHFEKTEQRPDANPTAHVKPPRKPVDKDSKKALKYRLSPEGIAENMARSHITEAESILVVLNDNCYMQAASEDWPDVKEISLNFIRELLPFTSCRETYDIVARTAQLYSTEVISTRRSIPERKRLAYFVSQLLGQMLKCEPYMKHLVATDLDGNQSLDMPVVRGILLGKIAPCDSIDVCGRYFRTEMLRAEQFRHRKDEAALIRAASEFRSHVATVAAFQGK